MSAGQEVERFDVAVLGAGAAGLLAAARAAERGRRTVLLERNRRAGAKILMSGGTRCNVTSAEPPREIVAAFGKRKGRFLWPAMKAFDNAAVMRLLEELGVPLKVERHGEKQKVFPVSDRATDVLAALLRLMQRSGAELRTGWAADRVERSGEGFLVGTERGAVAAARVIVTTGGASYPKAGTTGDGYRFAREMGHTIVTPVPALVPLTVEAGWVRELAGVTLPDVGVDSLARGERVDRRRGSLLFTHFGLSGPAAMDGSGALARALQRGERPLAVACDWCPGEHEHEIDARLREQAGEHPARLVRTIAAPELPARLVAALMRLCGIDADQRAGTLRKDLRRALAARLKRTELEVASTRGFAKAEVTAGGVDLAEVSDKDCASRLVPGLHFAGEVLDLDGPIGGYNFQSAFSTGWLAGSSV